MTALASSSASSLSGTMTVPGDKSISHRAVMFGAMAAGTTQITGLLEGEDVLSTAAAMREMGAHVEKQANGSWIVEGVGDSGLKTPGRDLDLGNSGTSARLIAGIISGYGITATLIGDPSLQRRPMKRVMDPLAKMGAKFTSQEGGRLPLTIQGRDPLIPIDYEMPVASAQVKSAIILAALRAAGTSRIREIAPSRDHTERMLAAFGGHIAQQDDLLVIQGGQKLTAPRDAIVVPGDPSSAAFAAVAALIIPGSEITIQNVGLNPTRAGIYDTLRDMGGDIEVLNKRVIGGEPAGDLRVRSSALRGVHVPEDRVPSMIDEFPILSVAASFAHGATHMTGLEELRVKESDRLRAIAAGLEACGVRVAEGESELTVLGDGKPPRGGGKIETHLDHRIAMSFLVMGAASRMHVEIDDDSAIATSFPGFVSLMNNLGTQIRPVA
ncbi:MAG TPA: 3-phosphoshikimate 1-carboxyvinyltransferase [Alphaproteobacteria bacterium]